MRERYQVTTCSWMGTVSIHHCQSRSLPLKHNWALGLYDMSNDAAEGIAMSSDEMLREILRKQEESLDLKGQLVLLNEKMDTLIDTMNTKLSAQVVRPPSFRPCVMESSVWGPAPSTRLSLALRSRLVRARSPRIPGTGETGAAMQTALQIAASGAQVRELHDVR